MPRRSVADGVRHQAGDPFELRERGLANGECLAHLAAGIALFQDRLRKSRPLVVAEIGPAGVLETLGHEGFRIIERPDQSFHWNPELPTGQDPTTSVDDLEMSVLLFRRPQEHRHLLARGTDALGKLAHLGAVNSC